MVYTDEVRKRLNPSGPPVSRQAVCNRARARGLKPKIVRGYAVWTEAQVRKLLATPRTRKAEA